MRCGKKAIYCQQLSWCYNDYNPENGKMYGKFYFWFSVNYPRCLFPLGCHIPTEGNRTPLTDYLGGWEVAKVKM
jgi:uncharacterized protein (TIGR02145 family)